MNELTAYFRNKYPEIDKDTLKLIDEKTTIKSYPIGNFILRESQVCKSISFIVSGSARTFQYNHNGSEQTLYFALENEWITSYHSFLTNQPSDVSIECLENTEIIVFPKFLLTKLYKQTTIANYIGRIIAENLYLQEYERNKDLLTLNATEHYEKLIKTKPKLLQRVKLQYIASYMGIAKESLSRIRNQKF